MKKENKVLLINLGALLVIGIMFVVAYMMLVPKTGVDKIFGKAVQLETATLTQDKPVEVKSKEVIKSGDTVLGTLYHVSYSNSYYLNSKEDSLIDFNLIVTTDNLVYVDLIAVNQSSFAREGIIKYVEKEFNGIKESDVKIVAVYNVADMDASGGVTAKDSVTSIKDTILKVLDFHYERKVSVYEELFGEGYTLGEKVVVDSGIVKHSFTITGSKGQGVVYYLEGFGNYNGDNSEKLLGARIILDENDVLIGYDFDDEEVVYEHTKGFQRHVKAFLDEFIKDGLDIKALTEGVDTQSGASFSKALMYEMLLELSSFVKDGE